MMRACLDVFMKSLPCFGDIFLDLLLEVRNLTTKEIGFTNGEEFDEEVV